jgi:protein transport protein SEC31
MDDDFNSEAFLEIRTADLTDLSSADMTVVARTLIPDRVHRIDWSPHGGAHGIVAGAFTDGTFMVWSVDVMLANGVSGAEEHGSPVLCHANAHGGAIRGLQFNKIQPHFLATGGVDKELSIWSLENPASPLAVPALTKSTHASEITDVKWNPKFAHILATATSSGVVTVWDLKAKRAALSFNVSPTQQGGANAIAWHPEVSTHLAVARDEASPVIQFWDLKKAMAPVRELRGHSQGITGLSWCRAAATGGPFAGTH